MKSKRFILGLLLLLGTLLIGSCGSSSRESEPVPEDDLEPSLEVSEEEEEPAEEESPAKQQLAFIQGGNLFLSAVPDGTPIKLTDTNDIISFVWSPDGTRLATFNGSRICFVELENKNNSPCIDWESGEEPDRVFGQMVWSPDQQHLVILNSYESFETSNWLIVPLDSSAPTRQIHDPFEQESDLNKDDELPLITGFMGEPLFLRNGTLIGTVGHTGACGSGGCAYEIFEFSFGEEDLDAYKTSDYFANIGQDHRLGRDLALSANGRVLANLAVYCAGADNCGTGYYTQDLASKFEQSYNFEEVFDGQALSPDGTVAVLGNRKRTEQAMFCGEAFLNNAPMQLLELEPHVRAQTNLSIPGENPEWSYNGRYIAFESCLALSENEEWIPTAPALRQIFLIDLTTSHLEPMPFAEGILPSWRP